MSKFYNRFSADDFNMLAEKIAEKPWGIPNVLESYVCIQWPNDGRMSEKDVGYPITLNGELGGEKYELFPIGTVIKVTPDFVVGAIMSMHFPLLKMLGYDSPPYLDVTMEVQNEQINLS